MSVQLEFRPADFFVLRTPLLPFAAFTDWGAPLAAPDGRLDSLEQTLSAARAQLRAVLQAQLAQPVIREAIFVASPDLDAGVAHWLANPASEKGLRAEKALVRYFARMAGRATPFGLFAGYSMGTIIGDKETGGQGDRETRRQGDKETGRQEDNSALRTPHSALVLGPQSAYQRHTRLDMDYLFALTETLNRDPAIQHTLCYRPNSSLYRAAGRLRYAEARLEDKMRTYYLVVVEENEYLYATLERAQNGATPSELAVALCAADPEIPLAEAETYIGELIASQLLVSELAPAVTGREPIHGLIDLLNRTPATQTLAQPLLTMRDELARLDADGLGSAPQRYRALAEPLDALPAPVELARLFQVDMRKPATATLGATIIAELTRGVALLQRINHSNQDSLLTRFRDRFVQRYESRAVPLMEALDEEHGIGFGVGDRAEHAPLLNGLIFPSAPSEATTPWGAPQAWLLRRLADVWRQGAHELALTEQDLAALANPDPRPLPTSFAVTATIAAASPVALDKGDFQIYLENVRGPSGVRLLGRFCHGDLPLQQAVEQYLAAEAAHDPDALFAEVVHLPEGRIGNMLCRPVLRPVEIPYLGQSGAAVANQIPVTDLWVSVVDGQVVLRSHHLGRRIIPRLTTAHFVSLRSQGVYQFLYSLQFQGIVAHGLIGGGKWDLIGGVKWEWGVLEDADFLPRVTYGRLVLARARWNLQKAELQRLGKCQGAELWRVVQTWRGERGLPRFVLLVDANSELPVDLDNILSIESFVDVVKQQEAAQLHELFPGPDELCATGPEGRFVHELIVPFVRREDRETGRQGDRETGRGGDRETGRGGDGAALREAEGVRRTFPPGSAWLYAKLYTGAATADQVLREGVAPAVRAALESGAADRWFFMRYADPDWHLRLRIHGDPQSLHDEVWPRLQATCAALLDAGWLWRLQLDTYEREVERYGGATGIELAERLFHVDSEAVLQMIEQLDGDAGADARWRLTLRGLDGLLDDLGFDLPTKQTVMRQTARHFMQEFRVDSHLRRQLGERQRKERQNLAQLLAPDPHPAHPLAPGFVCLRQRTAQLAPIVAELKAAEQAGRLTKPLTALAGSYLHMHANRLLRSAQRAQELVLYDLLDRYYTSQLARP